MKTKDLQSIVLSKSEKGDTQTDNPLSFKQWNQFSNDQKLMPNNSSV